MKTFEIYQKQEPSQGRDDIYTYEIISSFDDQLQVVKKTVNVQVTNKFPALEISSSGIKVTE